MLKLHQQLRTALQRVADPAKAAPMQRYMKSAMPFLGVQTPLLRRTCRDVFASHPFSSAAAWRGTCLSIWRNAQYREERHAALDLTGSCPQFQTLAILPMYEEMIVTGAWWDYVDLVAAHRLGPLLRQYPAPMRKKMLQWSKSKNMWRRRSSILCQLTFKRDTDLQLLYACIEPSLESKEVFLQKAIGWALRQYAWTDRREISGYVEEYADRLSALSKREALKNIKKR